MKRKPYGRMDVDAAIEEIALSGSISFDRCPPRTLKKYAEHINGCLEERHCP